MAVPESEIEVGLGNDEPTIASTLRPGAMVAAPLLTTALLPSRMRLPGTLRRPSPLLLPRGRLHLCPLRFLCGRLRTLRLMGRLRLSPVLGLLRRLLYGLRALLLRLSLRFGVALGLRLCPRWLSLRLRLSCAGCACCSRCSGCDCFGCSTARWAGCCGACRC